MKIEKPQFELTHVSADGAGEAPEMIPVESIYWDSWMSRRTFLGVGVGAASVMLLGCSQRLTTKETRGKLAISGDGKTLATTESNTIKLWSLPEGKLLTTLEGHIISVNALAISPDGKILASSDLNEVIRLWLLPEGKLLTTTEGRLQWEISAMAISPDGKTLRSSQKSKKLQIWA
jgi:WD40 repeat protein